jgi:hypothetical protein
VETEGWKGKNVIGENHVNSAYLKFGRPLKLKFGFTLHLFFTMMIEIGLGAILQYIFNDSRGG